MLQGIMMTALAFVGTLMIFIVLLQRGRGGGLAGAFGGAGGQSAFGTKAGDVFTKITVVLAVIWVFLAGASIWALNSGRTKYPGGDPPKNPAMVRPDAEEPQPPPDASDNDADGEESTAPDVKETESTSTQPDQSTTVEEADDAVAKPDDDETDESNE